MTVVLGDNRYGKSGIRLVKVVRDGERHALVDLTVDVRLQGDFAAAHVDGDNANILPTDSMRGAVYALAAKHRVDDVESFGLRLADHFLDAAPAVSRAEVRLVEQGWQRITVDAAAHPHAFTKAAGGQRTATVARERDGGTTVVAGIADLYVLKTAGSGFAGFHADQYTTLAPTDDRILATSVTANWRYRRLGVDYDRHATQIPQVLLETFAGHDHSRSLQHTLWAMGRAVLEACPDVSDIAFSLPNQHHIPADLAPYGLVNDREVFVATDRPFGVIEGTVTRDAEG